MDRHDIVRQVAIRQAELNINDSELSDMVGLTRSGMSIAKKNGFPKIQTLKRIADALNCDIEINLKSRD